MRFKRGKYKISISDDVLLTLEKFKQKEGENESGGIILGLVYHDSSVCITKISLPNSSDKASRFSFERDKKIAQAIVDEEFYSSNGKIIYLGEWHTHPEPHPLPSSVDIKMIKKQFKKNTINEDFLIMMIQGTENLYLAVYNGSKIIIK